MFVYHKFLLKVLGIRVVINGTPSNRKPLILIGNHCSYLDIIILGSVLPVCFVAKSEIKGWFLFGLLASLQNSIFIDRRNLKTLDSLKNVTKNLSTNFKVPLCFLSFPRNFPPIIPDRRPVDARLKPFEWVLKICVRKSLPGRPRVASGGAPEAPEAARRLPIGAKADFE